MHFFVADILFPCVAFVVLAALVLRRQRHATPRPRRSAAWRWGLGSLVFAGTACYFAWGLRSSDGWAGNAGLLLALGSGAAALHCLAGLTLSLIARAATDDAPGHLEAARQRALDREQLRRLAPARSGPTSNAPSRAGTGVPRPPIEDA